MNMKQHSSLNKDIAGELMMLDFDILEGSSSLSEYHYLFHQTEDDCQYNQLTSLVYYSKVDHM